LVINTQFAGSSESYNLQCWQTAYGKDVNSKTTPVQYNPYSVSSFTGSNLFSNGTFNANINGLYCWSSSSDCATTWDNSGKLDGGCLKVTPGTISQTLIVLGVGAVSSLQNYILKFSLLGSNTCKSIGVYLRQSNSPYSNLTPVYNFTVKPGRTENEFLFSAPVTESNASIGFSFSADVDSFWIDNISLQPANITNVNPDDSILFFYNPTANNKTFSLPAGKSYIDVKQKIYSSSVQLSPFTSNILLYKNQTATGFGENKTSSAKNSFSIYPNPASQSAFIIYQLSENSNVKISVYDLPGKEILQLINEKQNVGEHQLTFDTGQLPNGIYFVKIDEDGEYQIQKLIINK
jgi:hypothetical protein